jgi:gliding motility-associated protein GldM
MPGENLKVYAGVGATSSAAAPQVTINGRAVSLNSDGLAEVEIPGGGTGAHKVNVSIRYVDQDGQQQTINKVLDYAVGAPSGVSVSADKMNVLYIGVENPLTITAGVGSEKVNASFNAGTISRVRGSSWVAVPKTPGEHNINVNVDGKVTPIKFRVKHLPPPTAFIGGKQGGTVPSADFKVQGGVVARLLDSEFEVAYRVISYDVGALGGNYQTYQTSKNNGNRWSGDAGRIIENATPGTRIFIDNINVVGPDGRTQVLPALNFLLR